MSRVLDAPGTIIVVDNDAKLLRTLSVPSPSMRNFAFGPVERCFIPSLFDQDPWAQSRRPSDMMRQG